MYCLLDAEKVFFLRVFFFFKNDFIHVRFLLCTSFVGFLVIFQFFARLVFKVKLMRYHSCDCNRKH